MTLRPPTVPASAYSTSYYRKSCMGSTEWAASGGADVHGVYPLYLDMAKLAAGETLVDIGAGRGELVALAAERGAKRAIGVEYSSDAVELARQTLEAHGSRSNAEVMLADARSLPLADEMADVATLLDVVEHLDPEELSQALREAHRILRPGGRILIHTMPNRLYYDITWRALQALRPHWPRDPRNDLERKMHINEQTRRGLQRSLVAADFVAANVWYGEWLHDQIIPAPRVRRAVRWLARHRTTACLGSADLWASAIRD